MTSTASPTPATETSYPPAPWRLRGQAHFHVLVVSADRLPRTPPGFRPLTVAGHGLVIAGWVDYQDGSILRYGELLAAVVGRWPGGATSTGARRRGGLTATVTHMWVDSAASRAGGRELWGYPKEMAQFELAIDPSGTARATDEAGRELARGSFHARLTSPLAVTARGGTVQPLDGRLISVRALFGGRPSLGRGTIGAPANSPLAFLAGARRLASLGLRDFDFTFGV